MTDKPVPGSPAPSVNPCIPPEPERRCAFCECAVEDIAPRIIPSLTTNRPLPKTLTVVVQQCPKCRLLYAEGELRRWWAAMEAE